MGDANAIIRCKLVFEVYFPIFFYILVENSIVISLPLHYSISLLAAMERDVVNVSPVAMTVETVASSERKGKSLLAKWMLYNHSPE